MIKKIALVLGILIAGVLTLAAFKTGDMSVSREMVMAASPEILFPYINNGQKSYEWMPWAESDPGVQVSFSGPAEGVGCKSSWTGKQMGVGSSEVIESVANQVVKTRLDYTKPFEMSQLAEISLTPATGGTLVKWSVSGHNSFFFRLMGMFVDCDKMIGGEFEKGLSKLKSLVEGK